MKIRMIGYGRLAKSLIQQWEKNHSIIVSSPSLKNEKVTQNLQTTNQNRVELSNANLVILAVKPSIIKIVLNEISPFIPSGCLLISLAAAIDLNFLETHCPSTAFITRVMPNIAAEIQSSATLALKHPKLNAEHIKIINELFIECGTVDWVDNDKYLDLATIIAGSGPAYVFYFMEALQKEMIQLGLPKDLTQNLVYQTMNGSIKLAKNQMSCLNQKIEQVCSPKGVTAQALEVFEKQGLKQIIKNGLNAALSKIDELKP